MNKEDILNVLKEFNLDKSKFIILSGSALVLMGYKDKTNDIDITVTKDYYEYLLNNYKCDYDTIDSDGNKVYYIDNKINFGLNYWTNDKKQIHGYNVQSLEEIINLKKKLNREKDRKDLENIYKLINKE